MHFAACRFFAYSVKKDVLSFALVFFALRYFFGLFVHIVASNIHVMRVMLSIKPKLNPGLIEFKPELKSKAARYVLGTSITLTPSTYTVGLRDGEFSIHSLDVDIANLDSLKSIKLLEKAEEKYYG